MGKALDNNTPDRAVPRSNDICDEDSCAKIHSEEKNASEDRLQGHPSRVNN